MELEFLQACYAQADLPHPLLCFMEADEVLSYVRGAVAGDGLLPVCLLVDVRLTGCDGFELVERLRQLASLRCPIVLLSNSPGPLDMDRARELGVDLRKKPTGVKNYVQFLHEIAGGLL
jgi:CheY-like chemotaxis protein